MISEKNTNKSRYINLYHIERLLKWQLLLDVEILSVRLYHFIKKGQYKRETKTFPNKQDAELWALEMELEKGRGKDIAERYTLFTDFYRNWVNYLREYD